ncbi:hypothetical protein L3X37_05515 [Sabulilitoribacter arenilitoris]|uniref:3-keto-disaccharide hydrolase domain-containing protein n=1 Tax=Wocania arenilitoris TaxID=2044858 RepID=A0AAE3EN00_9FLAO|nr:hypothetical protein [Wocania arenilitoris]MCF7567822.1 hypothetical protein [Wocania arenilitoris]
MKKIIIIFLIGVTNTSFSQNIIPLDTLNWRITTKSFVAEKYKGKNSVYVQGGSIILKDVEFINGTIEFDVFLKEEQAFPGVEFRVVGENAEQFFLRPHLSGKADANQAAPKVNGITPFQLNFGPKYSFPYTYKYNDWTHVKVVVNNDKAQVFLDYSDKPNLSWHLTHLPVKGGIAIRGGRRTGIHLADVKVNKEATTLIDFKPIERKPIEGLIPQWKISDMFEENQLNNPENLNEVLKNRTWQGVLKIEEGTAANISRIQVLYNGEPGNTVFAKVVINSDKDQLKLFEFGYSDRAVAILNGKPIYRGTNKWRSRDYRYLGTVGLFDAIYLNLKKGKNELLMAVSEDFGGWLITGRFKNKDGINIDY